MGSPEGMQCVRGACETFVSDTTLGHQPEHSLPQFTLAFSYKAAMDAMDVWMAKGRSTSGRQLARLAKGAPRARKSSDDDMQGCFRNANKRRATYCASTLQAHPKSRIAISLDATMPLQRSGATRRQDFTDSHATPFVQGQTSTVEDVDAAARTVL